MGTFSENLLLIEPTPGDPAVKNAWGLLLNTNFALIDSAVAGILALDVSGNSNVILTSTSGEPDQARNADFVFAGVLTGNITIFWPISLSGMFSVLNETTGAFSLTLAVNNGSGSPDGATVVVPQGSSMNLKSNGTDILERATYTTFANTPAAQQATVRNNLGVASQAGAENFAIDTGTANHLVAALSPAVTALTSGLMVTLTVLNPNTGATDFNLNSLGAKTVYKPGTGGPIGLASGDLETANDLILVYDAALNSAAGGWFILGGLSITTFAGGVLTATTTMSGAAFNEATDASLAAAATTDLSSVASNNVYLSGASPVTITSWGSLPAGARRWVRNASGVVFTIQNNGNTNNLTGANVAMAVNDVVVIRGLGGGAAIMDGYFRNNGGVLASAAKADMVAGTSATLAVTPSVAGQALGAAKAWIVFDGQNGSVLDSFNVSNLVQIASTTWQITFTVAFANSFYAMSGSINEVSGSSDPGPLVDLTFAPTISQIQIITTLVAPAARISLVFHGRQ